MLLGRPWQFDVDAILRGKTYPSAFVKDGLKIVFVPSPSTPQSTSPTSCASTTELVDTVTHLHDSDNLSLEVPHATYKAIFDRHQCLQLEDEFFARPGD